METQYFFKDQDMQKLTNMNSSSRSESGSTVGSGSVLKSNSARRTALSCATMKELRFPYYCEENVWRLAYRLLYGNSAAGYTRTDQENTSYWVVFISNEQKCCPMFQQCASEDPETKPCIWDYHAIFLECATVTRRGRTHKETNVFDMDTVLPFPVSLQDYFNRTFIRFSNKETDMKYAPLFRVVRADTFLMHFYSDRSHMKKQDGSWIAPPPTYDCITTADAKLNSKGQLSNLDGFIRMRKGKEESNSSNIYGDLLTLEQMQNRFHIIKTVDTRPSCLGLQTCI